MRNPEISTPPQKDASNSKATPHGSRWVLGFSIKYCDKLSGLLANIATKKQGNLASWPPHRFPCFPQLQDAPMQRGVHSVSSSSVQHQAGLNPHKVIVDQ